MRKNSINHPLNCPTRTMILNNKKTGDRCDDDDDDDDDSGGDGSGGDRDIARIFLVHF